MTALATFGALLLAVASQSATEAEVHRVPGAVHDVAVVGAGEARATWVSTLEGKKRKLYALGARLKSRSVPKDAVFAAICPDGAGGFAPVFADAKGLVDTGGRRVLNAAAEGQVPLMQTPDPERLHFAPLCAVVDGVLEHRFFTLEGMLIKRGERTIRLRYPHRARSYAGGHHRGIHSELGYAAAASTYVPHLYDADVDGDGKRDLVVRHQRRVTVFKRDPEPRSGPATTVDVARLVGADSETSMNVMVGDIDGDGRADLVTGLAQGLLAEKSSAWAVLSSDKGAFVHPRRLWSASGLRLPIALVRGRSKGARRIVTATVDTSLVALGQALVASAIDVDIGLADAQGKQVAGGPNLSAGVDVRRGEMKGALPVLAVDLDGDGYEDLVDIARHGELRLHAGGASGFPLGPSSSHAVAPLGYAKAFTGARAVVLVAPAELAKNRRGRKKKTTTVTVVVSRPPSDKAPLGRRSRGRW